MTIDDVRRKALRGVKDVSAYTANYDFSDCVYDSIQEMQTNSLCSRVEIRKAIDRNYELGSIAVVDGGSGYVRAPDVSISDNFFDQCAVFGGTNSYITMPSQNFGKTQSIEFTFIADNLTQQPGILGRPGSTDFLYLNPSGVFFSAGGSTTINWTFTFTLGERYHILMIRSGLSVWLYIDNVLISTVQTLSANNDCQADRVGYYAGVQYFDGKMGKLRVYSSALTDGQRERQWNEGFTNTALDIPSYLEFEFDGTGGLLTTETSAGAVSVTGTFSGDMSRGTWPTTEPAATEKARAEAIVTDGVVTGVVVTNHGKGYYVMPSVTFSGGGGSGANATANLSTTTFEKVITSKYGGSSTGDMDVECLYVDAAFKVDTDGTKIPIKLIDRYTISAEKDLGISYTGSDDLRGAVVWNKNNIVIFTPWDMTGCTLELWIRFQIPYVQDANVGANANSYLDTVPVQFQNRLISGVKYHIYEAMEELSGFSGKYQPMMKVFGDQWFHRDLPYVKQEVNGTKAAETVHFVKPATVAGLE
jgi:hypothetical protein